MSTHSLYKWVRAARPAGKQVHELVPAPQTVDATVATVPIYDFLELMSRKNI